MRIIRLLGISLVAIFSQFAFAQEVVDTPIPQLDQQKHLGVASCASSQCHGSVTAKTKSQILGTEYALWTKHDKHASAYNTLFNAQSRSIAAKLGLKNAHEADICLDCHADNVAAELRGPKHLMEDGVGCEACHGGSEKWLTSHIGGTHEENVSAGLYPTDDTQARAKLCLSCHYGTENKFATHRIMGAGHPRLSFELDTFLVRQPLHYIVDDDYIERKGQRDETAQRWAIGMIETANSSMNVLDGPLFANGGFYPEVALFDCHACHHTFNELKWQPRPSLGGIGPGVVRLNDSSLLIVSAIAKHVDIEIGNELVSLIKRYHSAETQSRQAVMKVSRSIREQLAALSTRLQDYEFNQEEKRGILKQIVDMGIKGEFSDYVGAEQAVMAVDLLTYSLGGGTELGVNIDNLYAIVKEDDAYRARNLVSEFKTLNGSSFLR